MASFSLIIEDVIKKDKDAFPGFIPMVNVWVPHLRNLTENLSGALVCRSLQDERFEVRHERFAEAWEYLGKKPVEVFIIELLRYLRENTFLVNVTKILGNIWDYKTSFVSGLHYEVSRVVWKTSCPNHWFCKPKGAN